MTRKSLDCACQKGSNNCTSAEAWKWKVSNGRWERRVRLLPFISVIRSARCIALERDWLDGEASMEYNAPYLTRLKCPVSCASSIACFWFFGSNGSASWPAAAVPDLRDILYCLLWMGFGVWRAVGRVRQAGKLKARVEDRSRQRT